MSEGEWGGGEDVGWSEGAGAGDGVAGGGGGWVRRGDGEGRVAEARALCGALCAMGPCASARMSCAPTSAEGLPLAALKAEAVAWRGGRRGRGAGSEAERRDGLVMRRGWPASRESRRRWGAGAVRACGRKGRREERAQPRPPLTAGTSGPAARPCAAAAPAAAPRAARTAGDSRWPRQQVLIMRQEAAGEGEGCLGAQAECRARQGGWQHARVRLAWR